MSAFSFLNVFYFKNLAKISDVFPLYAVCFYSISPSFYCESSLHLKEYYYLIVNTFQIGYIWKFYGVFYLKVFIGFIT